MAVYGTVCSAEYRFLLFCHFHINLETAFLKLYTSLLRGFKVVLTYTKCARQGEFVVCINVQIYSSTLH